MSEFKDNFKIVLVEPEIPPNTGNVARLCAVTGCSLHLVKPLGFSIDDRQLKRAGLDYWHLLDVHYYEGWQDFLSKNPGAEFFLATTKGGKQYHQISYPPGSFLVFGRETKGLAPEILAAFPERCIRLPMRQETRSLNLSNAVAVVVYEALRQQSFAGLV